MGRGLRQRGTPLRTRRVLLVHSGYEWTPATRDTKSPNFHRNIIFEGGPGKACQLLPFSIQDSRNVEDLWAHLDRYERETGGKVLAIPHNGNLSNGRMFLPVDFDGNPIGVEYARTRERWEPIYEMTQIKGDAETHPVLSPNDEFADFETWPRGERPHILPPEERPADFAERKRHEYARSALMVGLDLQASLGVNPFKFGMIGATDAHTGLATADEDNWWGKHTMVEANPYRALTTWHYASGGYAAVWARDNTRESIFAAMRRREVYATTGPRMIVRFFGGFDFEAADADRADLAATGYAKGVPMGGDLTAAPAQQSPRFLIRAIKDPDGANLDRVQIVKGWRDRDGRTHERVYDVALSDDRKPTARGNAEPVGNTVDGASYDNSIGDPELAIVWTDPDFDAGALAFYYVRVLQIPRHDGRPTTPTSTDSPSCPSTRRRRSRNAPTRHPSGTRPIDPTAREKIDRNSRLVMALNNGNTQALGSTGLNASDSNFHDALPGELAPFPAPRT